jgi:PEP-CTERM motif
LICWQLRVRRSNFTIINSTNPSIRGGVFSGGATYYGGFSIDTSLIPSDGSAATISLASFDLFVTPIGQPVIEISSAGSFTAGSLILSAEFPEGGLNLQFDEPQFAHAFLNDILELDLVEVVGSFNGGLVLHATEEEFATFPPVTRNDSSASALIVDRALVPEPSSMTLLGAGAAVSAALRRRHRFA